MTFILLSLAFYHHLFYFSFFHFILFLVKQKNEHNYVFPLNDLLLLIRFVCCDALVVAAWKSFFLTQKNWLSFKVEKPLQQQHHFHVKKFVKLWQEKKVQFFYESIQPPQKAAIYFFPLTSISRCSMWWVRGESTKPKHVIFIAFAISQNEDQFLCHFISIALRAKNCITSGKKFIHTIFAPTPSATLQL